MAGREIEQLVAEFVSKLTALVDRDVAGRLRDAVGGLSDSGGAQRQRVPRSRRLQGRYIGLLRKLSGSTRERVQSAARQSGVPTALALAAKLGVS